MLGQLTKMKMQRIGDMALTPFIVAAHVNNSHRTMLTPTVIKGFHVNTLKTLDGQSCRLPACDAAFEIALRLFIANTDKLHSGLTASFLIFSEDHEWCVERQQPADIGAKGGIQFNIDRAWNMFARESITGASIYQGNACLHLLVDSLWRICLRHREGTENARALVINFPHVCIVTGIGCVTCNLPPHKIFFILCLRGGTDEAFLGDSSATSGGDGAGDTE